MNIGEIRAKYPQYSDLSDGQLADALHSKNYADMPKDEFYSKIGFDIPEQHPTQEGGGAKEAFGMGLAGAVPYGQRITSGLGAVMARPFTDQSVSELYEQAQQYGQATQEAHPIASGAGTVAGIGATLPLASAKVLAGALPTQGARGALNVIPKGLAAVGNFARGGKVAKDASLAAKTGSLALRSAKGGVVAAPVAGLYAAGESEDQAEGFKLGAGMGAGFGAALPVAGAALGVAGAALGVAGRAVLPKIDDALADVAQLAKKHSIPLSLDQITSSKTIKNLQKVSQELPFSGQSGFRDKQMDGFNKALLKTIGVKGNKFTKPVMHKAFKDLGKKFDDMGRGKTFVIDDDFMRKLDSLRDEARETAGQDAINNFNTFVEKALKDVDGLGNVSGEKLNGLRVRANQLARKTKNPETNSLIHDFENMIVDLMTAGDDEAIKAFSKTKQQYKNLIAIEPLAAKAKAGNISPTLLNQRVSRIYGRQHTRGQSGDIGELAQIGHELLPELGGSDTTQKMLMASGITAGVVNPATLALTGGVVAGNRMLQSALNRNQALISRAIKGVNVTEELMRLPPKEASSVIQILKQQGINLASKKDR